MSKYFNFLDACKRGDLVAVKGTVETSFLNNGLVEAATYNKLDVVKFLLEEGATDLETALIQSAKWGQYDTVEYLLQNGADVHAENDSALRYSASRSHENIVDLLVRHGANIYVIDDSVVKDAENYNDFKFVDRLRKIVAKKMKFSKDQVI